MIVESAVASVVVLASVVKIRGILYCGDPVLCIGEYKFCRTVGVRVFVKTQTFRVLSFAELARLVARSIRCYHVLGVLRWFNESRPTTRALVSRRAWRVPACDAAITFVWSHVPCRDGDKPAMM